MQIAMFLAKPGQLRKLVVTLAVTSAAAAVAATAVLNEHPLFDEAAPSAAAELSAPAALRRHAPLAEAAASERVESPAAAPGADEAHAPHSE